MMAKRLLLIMVMVGLAACEDESTFVAGSLSQPVDFAFACEGQDHTVAPQDDQSAAAYDATRMCGDVTHGSVSSQGDLLGLVLNQSPPSVHVVQMNPASGNEVRVVDASRFVPGYTGIQVGKAPVRVLRDSNYGAFYVLNAGSQDVTRIVLRSFHGELDAAQATFNLPGTPSDGLVLDGKLIVTSAFRPELWILDTNALEAPAQVVSLPDRVHTMTALNGDALAITWKTRPILSLIDGSGQWDPAGDVALVPACRDTLDNDGDGSVDHADDGCRGGNDSSEESAPTTTEEVLEPINSFASGLYCDDGIDNDGDGLVDGQDPSCAANGTGERVPECSDGIDNDGDGHVDLEDDSCYDKAGTREGDVYGDGPFHVASVNSSTAGQFVYVLDQSRAEILVFALTEDGFERVDVNAPGASIEELVYRSYGSDSTSSLPGLANPGYPALSHGHQRNIKLPSANLTSLTGFHGVGELWERGIAPEDGATVASVAEGLSSSTHWIPSGCDAGVSDECRQPPGDDDNHFVVGSRLDGSLQMIQAVYRGVPWHRFVQLSNDVSLRTIAISAPKLTVAGASVAVGSSVPEDQPFMGAMSTEIVQTAVSGVQHGLKRQYGIAPPQDPEEAPDEAWALTYQGIVPETEGVGGRLLDEGVFYAPGKAFCSSGVEAGDWLILEAAPQSMSSELHYPMEFSFEGEICPLKPQHLSRVQVAIVGVYEDSLKVDPTTAQAVPMTPVLAEDDLSLSRLKACRELVDQAVSDLGLVGGVTPMKELPDFASDTLPDRLTYRVRAGDWIAQGTRSGFAHRNTFVDGQCTVDSTLSERLQSRLKEATVIGDVYETCPPDNTKLTASGLETLVEGGAGFENHSFQLTMLPACRNTSDGIQLPGTRRDTRWSFSLNGTDSPTSIQVDGTTHSARSVPLHFRRQLIHLGTSGNRVTVLRVSPTTTVPISKFE